MFRLLPSRSLVLLALRCVLAAVSSYNLFLGIKALQLRPPHDQLGILFALGCFAPVVAWLLSFRSLRLGAWSYTVAFLIYVLAMTLNDEPCGSGTCKLSEFVVTLIPQLLMLSTLIFPFAAIVFFILHDRERRSQSEQVSSF